MWILYVIITVGIVILVMCLQKRKNNIVSAAPLTTSCQSCIDACPTTQYPNTDVAGCNAYNDCIIKCIDGSTQPGPCMGSTPPVEPITCGCGGFSQPYSQWDVASQKNVYFPGVCEYVGDISSPENTGMITPPYPKGYEIQCEYSAEEGKQYFPGICGCYFPTTGILLGPIVEAKPEMSIDCSKYDGTYPVCGCSPLDQPNVTDVYNLKKVSK